MYYIEFILNFIMLILKLSEVHLINVYNIMNILWINKITSKLSDIIHMEIYFL